MTINSYRLEETLILLENGCDVFARNIDSRTPKRVSNGNYLFTKLLTNFEMKILEKKYRDSNEDKNYKKRITEMPTRKMTGGIFPINSCTSSLRNSILGDFCLVSITTFLTLIGF